MGKFEKMISDNELQAVLDIYTQAGIEPTSITIDLFAAYGLYQQIPDYKNIPHASALVDVFAMSTRIAFLQDGELRLTRSIPRGIMTVVKGISEELGVSVGDIEKKLQLHGVSVSNDEAYNRVAQKQLIESLGIMAEAYVTAAVAGVLLIMIVGY
jgi:Tfp pilus assembly PilM family ATPase